MELFGKLLFVWLLAASFASATSWPSMFRRTQFEIDAVKSAEAPSLPPPSEDSFYNVPKGFRKEKPGTILKSRVSPNPLANYLGQPANVNNTYQLMFRSTNSVGKPAVGVTTIIVPNNATYSKLLSYQTAYDSANNDCSPSYQLLQGAESNTTASRPELVLMARVLKYGWVVNTPDYEGLDAAFTAGPQSGMMTLDSIRAALSSGSITGIEKTATYAMWGYSGGALASEWASEFQKSYAPELKFQGTALGGLTPNVTSVLYSINGNDSAGLAPTGILGLSYAYTNLSTFLDHALVPSKKATFYQAGKECLAQTSAQFKDQNLSMYFKQGFKALQDKVPQSVINAAGIMGNHGIPQMPLYVYKTIHDEISPIADTAKLVRKYCRKGVSVQFVRISKGDHEQGALYGLGGALEFLQTVMNGTSVPEKCSVTTTS